MFITGYRISMAAFLLTIVSSFTIFVKENPPHIFPWYHQSKLAVPNVDEQLTNKTEEGEVQTGTSLLEGSLEKLTALKGMPRFIRLLAKSDEDDSDDSEKKKKKKSKKDEDESSSSGEKKKKKKKHKEDSSDSDTDSDDDKKKSNYCKNGDFESPKLSDDKEAFQEVKDWTELNGNKITLGKGKQILPKWKKKVVCFLESKTHTSIEQQIQLPEEGVARLFLRYSAADGSQVKPRFTVKWNDDHTELITVHDSQKVSHYKRPNMKGLKGTNKLRISQVSGDVVITHVKLNFAEQDDDEEVSYVEELKQYKKEPTGINLILNGKFTEPPFSEKTKTFDSKDVPHWTQSNEKDIELGVGSQYSKAWSENVKVCNLHYKKPNSIEQEITLPEDGVYIIYFKYAASTDFVKSSKGAVYWNRKKIGEFKAKTDTDQFVFWDVQPGKKGKNVLKIKSDKKKHQSKGVTLTDVEVLLYGDKRIPPAPPTPPAPAPALKPKEEKKDEKKKKKKKDDD